MKKREKYLIINLWKITNIVTLTHYWHTYHILSRTNKESCKEKFSIKLVFISFKIKNHFSYQDPISDNFKSFLEYKFSFASCSSSYIAKTCPYFKTMIEEHIKKDNKSHAFKHLHSNTACFDPHSCFSLKIIDKANSKVNSKIKTVLRTNWKKPNLTWPLSPSSSLPLFWLISFSYCFSWLLMLFIGILYLFSGRLLLLHLTTVHLVNRFYHKICAVKKNYTIIHF